MKLFNSMGRVPSKREYVHPSLDDQIKKSDVLKRKEKVNRSIEWLGKKFRNIVEVLDPDQENRPMPTENRAINRRAGRTAIALIAATAALAGGAIYLEGAHDQEFTNTEEGSLAPIIPLKSDSISITLSNSEIN
jgi:hypothetical protein